MKKPRFKLFAALLVLTVSGIQAVHAQQPSDDVTLQVTLVAVQNISVNAGQTTVTLTFEEAGDYLNGVTSSQPNHLEVSSTGLFQVAVKASDINLVNGSNTIPVNTITVTPGYGTGGTDPGAIPAAVSLTGNDQIILDSNDGTAQAFYNVTYDASGGADYINKPAGIYTTTVTYTISPA